VDPVGRVLEIEVSEGKPVLFDFQRGVPTLWMQVDDSGGNQVRLRRFVMFGTGDPQPDELTLEHIGSAVGYEGKLVLHCFEEVLG
jgi:hypothetical protein